VCESILSIGNMDWSGRRWQIGGMKTLKANWRTTVAGLVTIGLTGFSMYKNPGVMADPNIIAQTVAGVGLLLATDATKKSCKG